MSPEEGKQHRWWPCTARVATVSSPQDSSGMQTTAPERHGLSTALYLLCLNFCSLHLPLEGGSAVWHYVPLNPMGTDVLTWQHHSSVAWWNSSMVTWWHDDMVAWQHSVMGSVRSAAAGALSWWQWLLVGAEPVWPNCVAFRFESSPNSELLHLWLWERSNLTFNFTKMCLYFECPLGTFTKRPMKAEPCDTHLMPGCLKGCIHSPFIRSAPVSLKTLWLHSMPL